MCDKRKAVLYCRVAPGAGKINEWVWLQREILREAAHQRGLSVVGEIMACESGTTMWRTGWASMLHILQQTQAGVLLVASYTRISRNTVELLQNLRQMQAQGVEVQVTDPMQEQTLQLLTTLSLYRG